MNKVTRLYPLLTLFLFLLWPLQLLVAQEAQRPVKDSVQALLDVVKDVTKFEKDLRGSEPVLFAFADRRGAIIGAVKDVVKAHQEKRAVNELVALIKARRLSTKFADELVCTGAANALEDFGPVAADALPTLILLKDHPGAMAKEGAKSAIERINKKDSKK